MALWQNVGARLAFLGEIGLERSNSFGLRSPTCVLYWVLRSARDSISEAVPRAIGAAFQVAKRELRERRHERFPHRVQLHDEICERSVFGQGNL